MKHNVAHPKLSDAVDIIMIEIFYVNNYSIKFDKEMLILWHTAVAINRIALLYSRMSL